MTRAANAFTRLTLTSSVTRGQAFNSGNATRDGRTQDAQRGILEALQDGARPRGELGGESGTFDRALKDLEYSGKVVKTGRGVYALALQIQSVSPPHQTPVSGVVAREEAVEPAEGEEWAEEL